VCGFGGLAEAAVGICFPSAEEGLWYGRGGAGRGGASCLAPALWLFLWYIGTAFSKYHTMIFRGGLSNQHRYQHWSLSDERHGTRSRERVRGTRCVPLGGCM